MRSSITESHVEEASLAWLESLGYAMLSRKVSGGERVQSGENPPKYIT